MSTPQTIEVSTIFVNDRNEPTTTTTKNIKKSNSIYRWIRTYFSKWTGQHSTIPPVSVTILECIIVFIATFVGIGLLSAIHYRLLAR